ncbi:hypothetical protein Tco_1345740 [Tanacetum coccineum]
MSDMTTCLNDLRYIPLNNEQNEPTHRDIDCDFVTGLDFMAKFTHFKVKGKLTGSIFNEMLEFFQMDVTTKFNRPDSNVDCPPPTCQYQVFRSICKSIGKRSIIRLDHQELKKVLWYVLHNNPKIDTYRPKFKSQFSNQDMKEEFPGWFGSHIRQRYIDKDPGVSESDELFALACGPALTPVLVNSCVVNDVRFVVHNRDKRHTTQNSGICSPGEKDGEMYYGKLEEILEFSYMSFKVVLFRVKWFDTSNEGQDDHDVIHFDNSSDLALSTSLNDLDFATLNIDGQSIDVDAPPDIIDVDEDDDFIDDEEIVPHCR